MKLLNYFNKLLLNKNFKNNIKLIEHLKKIIEISFQFNVWNIEKDSHFLLQIIYSFNILPEYVCGITIPYIHYVCFACRLGPN